MAKGIKLTDGDIAAILHLVAEGYPYAEVADLTGFGVATVCRTVQAQPDYAPPEVWTAETIAAPLERLYRSGMSYEAMAARLGISTGHLKRYRRRFGLVTRRNVTPEDRAEMVTLRNGGLFYREIARRTGWSQWTVENHLVGAEGVDGRRARQRQIEQARQWACRDYGQLWTSSR